MDESCFSIREQREEERKREGAGEREGRKRGEAVWTSETVLTAINKNVLSVDAGGETVRPYSKFMTGRSGISCCYLKRRIFSLYCPIMLSDPHYVWHREEPDQYLLNKLKLCSSFSSTTDSLSAHMRPIFNLWDPLHQFPKEPAPGNSFSVSACSALSPMLQTTS